MNLKSSGNQTPFYQDNSWATWLMVLAGILALGSMLGICATVWYSWVDDYPNMTAIQQRGVIGFITDGYMNWDGRIISPGYFVLAVCLNSLSAEMTTFVWCLVFIASAFFITLIIIEDLQWNGISWWNKLVLFFLICIVLWLGGYRYIGETIYWATGGFYSFMLLMGSAYLYAFIKLLKSEKKFTFLFFLASIIVGITTQNLALPVLTIIMLYGLLMWGKKNRKDLVFIGTSLTGVLIGIIVISVAPGNAKRMAAAHQVGGVKLSQLFNNIYTLFITYLDFSFFLILLGLLCAVFLLTVHTGKRIYKTDHRIILPDKFRGWIEVAFKFKWLLASLASLVPFCLSPVFASPRTAVYFHAFLLIFLIVGGYKIANKVFPLSFGDKGFNLKLVGYGVFSIVILLFCFLAIKNYRFGLKIKKQVTARDEILRNAKTPNMIVPKIDVKGMTFCYRYTELAEKGDTAKYWINESCARYYKLSSVDIE